MGQQIKFGFQRGLRLLLVALAIGVVAGWISLLTAEGAAALAASAARFFPLLIVILPLILIWLTRRDITSPNYLLYKSSSGSLLIEGTAALTGAIGGSVAFIAAAAQIPAVFGGQPAAETTSALYPAIGSGWFIALILVTLATGIASGLWANRQVQNAAGV